jgi:hypothetical protein
MPQYVLPPPVESEQFAQRAEVKFAVANHANGLADRYVRLTVMFATVLFFGGISNKFDW